MASIRTRKQTGKLYLDFYFDGARYREQTALPDTPENRTKLGKLADKLEREIARGKFNYAEFFGKPAKEPRVKASDAYPRAGGHQPGSGLQTARQSNTSAVQTPTFVEFLEIWRNENFVQFRKSYQRTVDDIFKAHLVPKFGNTRVGDIRREDLLTFRSDLAKAPGRKGLTMSPKRVNAIMALMSQIMSEASDRYHFTNPYQNIKSLRLRKPDVEPFTLQEVNLILNTVREDMRNYYIVRFFTGMRTGEIDGLKWKYVDLERRQILIRSTIVAGIEEEDGKTYDSIRDIEISEVVCQALKRQRLVTFRRSDYVFCNSVGQPLDHNNVTKRVWYPLLRHLGLARRRPYVTRHTAATLWLAAGENPLWIARQLGHSSTEMLYKVYGRFVPNLTRLDGSAFDRLLATNTNIGELGNALQLEVKNG